MSPKKNPHRKRTEFGAYLTGLRKERAKLSAAQAARDLEFNNRQRLYNYEIGPTIPPDSVLIKMARLYRVAPDEILRRAHWPQLIILPLVSIIDPEQLTKDIIQEIEQGLQRAERQKLTQYIAEIIQERNVGAQLRK